jgi:hypothetical protein
MAKYLKCYSLFTVKKGVLPITFSILQGVFVSESRKYMYVCAFHKASYARLSYNISCVLEAVKFEVFIYLFFFCVANIHV